MQIPFRGDFIRGIRSGTPIFLGYFPVGAAFGILAGSLGFSTAQSVLCSATALAGAGQFVALELLAGGSGALAVVAATAVVNLRYVLFGATISPHLSGLRSGPQAFLAFTLTDETFAVNVTDLRAGRGSPMSMAGVGAVAWTGWVAGTAAGAVAAGQLGDPSGWGVQFAMPAMFTALLVAQIESKRHVLVAAMAAGIALAASAMLSGAWYVLLASVIAATLGAAIPVDGGREESRR